MKRSKIIVGETLHWKSKVKLKPWKTLTKEQKNTIKNSSLIFMSKEHYKQYNDNIITCDSYLLNKDWIGISYVRKNGFVYCDYISVDYIASIIPHGRYIEPPNGEAGYISQISVEGLQAEINYIEKAIKKNGKEGYVSKLYVRSYNSKNNGYIREYVVNLTKYLTSLNRELNRRKKWKV